MKKRQFQPKSSKKPVIFLVGSTAIGKSQIALKLAQKLNAEIVSCDSMQIYKSMDIISAKLPRPDRKRIKHHLIDMIPASRSFNASDYSRHALAAIRKILNHARIPLFTGGCGFYMSAVLDGIFSEKTKDKEIRKRLYEEAQSLGKEALYKRLKNVDPAAALKIHPNDLRRVIRALEVYEKCGSPISELQKRRKGITDKYDIIIFGLNMDRSALYSRIDKRVDCMFEDGLLNEVSRLLKSRLSRTASGAIGIREIQGYLQGQYGLDEAKRLVKRNSRLYAKRQMTWFRKDKRIEWLEIKDNEKPQDIADKIYKKVRWKERY